MNSPRPWSATDDRLVLTLPAIEVAARTGRTLASVYRRRFRLRVGAEKRQWTAAEDRLLMWMPAEQAAVYLKRTLRSIDHRRRRLGLSGSPPVIN